MGANLSNDEGLTSCTHHSSNRDSVAYEPTSRYSPMSASTPSLRPPSAPPRAGSAPSSRWTPSLSRYKSSVLESTHSRDSSTSKLESSPHNKPESSSHSFYSRHNSIVRKSENKPQTPAVSAANMLASDSYQSMAAVSSSANNSLHSNAAAAATGPATGSCSCNCKTELENLQKEMKVLKVELNSGKETIKVLREREVQLRERLSEQARRQFEKGTTLFEDINLGYNRPTQLVRRYGNLYSEARLEALDSLDELIEVAQFKNLKGKLLLSVIVLAFRNARKNYEETKIKIKQLLHIPDVTRAANSVRLDRDHVTLNNQSGILKKDDTDAMIREVDDVISLFLRKTVDKHNLKKNYEEVCDRVWATLYDFPSLRHCEGLLKYIDESVRLAWALSVQNPPLVIDYHCENFNPDLHTRFHTSDSANDVVRCVLWPMLREGEGGACLYKAVVIT